ncbi:MFS transporter [Candidatus Chlorohelix sp.]|uniref:MFS transporter n=1 Tax=Candidatus Chlorohelix sp. TaxID=3139201 RepID=UPI00302AEB82
MKDRAASPRFHYAWVIAIITFLTLLTTAGIRSTPGVLLVPLGEDFHWNRATVSLAIAINLVLFGLFGPFAAALMDRFGVRRVMLIAFGTIACALLLTTIMTEPWQLYILWGGMVGTSTGATATVLAAFVTNRWFVKQRGLVLGVMTASNATGQLVFLPLLATLITSFGWRAASWTTLTAIIILFPLVAIFMRNRPSDKGLKAYGAEPDAVEPERSVGNPFANAINGLLRGLRSRDFWLLSGSFFICGATTNGLIGTHLIPASMDHGISEVTAASLLALIGIFDIIGTTASGWLSDRVDNRVLLAWYYGLRGLSLLFLPYALGTGFLSLAVFIVFYGLDWVATVPPTVRLTADIFGKASAAVIFGWIFAAHQLGAAFASFGAGTLYTILGDYQVSFLLAGLLSLIASGLVIRIGHKSGKIPPTPKEVSQQAA